MRKFKYRTKSRKIVEYTKADVQIVVTNRGSYFSALKRHRETGKHLDNYTWYSEGEKNRVVSMFVRNGYEVIEVGAE